MDSTLSPPKRTITISLFNRDSNSYMFVKEPLSLHTFSYNPS